MLTLIITLFSCFFKLKKQNIHLFNSFVGLTNTFEFEPKAIDCNLACILGKQKLYALSQIREHAYIFYDKYGITPNYRNIPLFIDYALNIISIGDFVVAHIDPLSCIFF